MVAVELYGFSLGLDLPNIRHWQVLTTVLKAPRNLLTSSLASVLLKEADFRRRVMEGSEFCDLLILNPGSRRFGRFRMLSC